MDLSTQLQCDVILPELSGFGGYHSGIRKYFSSDKKAIIQQWTDDAKNSFEFARKLLNLQDLSNICVYAKGISTSIVFKLLKTMSLKYVILENSLYMKHRRDLLIDTVKTLKSAKLAKLKRFSSAYNSDSSSLSSFRQSGKEETVPSFLILDRNNLRQMVHTTDIINTLLSKMYGVKDISKMKRLQGVNDSYVKE
jgi:hypothetical protein